MIRNESAQNLPKLEPNHRSCHFDFIIYWKLKLDKELYALLQSVKKWNNYLMGKETIIHIDHQPLQYSQLKTKLQQATHFIWMGFLQQFHLVIKYEKCIYNKGVEMSSSHIVNVSVILKHNPIMHEIYIEHYA